MPKNGDSQGNGLPIGRRDVCKAMGATIAGSLLPVSVASASGDATVLGDFEESFDGWKTNGGNSLDRVTAERWDRPVTSGSHALEVRSNGDPYPLVFNTDRASEADFWSNQYMLADVTVGGLEDGVGALAFTMRYHHSAGKGGGKGGDSPGGNPPGQGRSPNVEVFDPIPVPEGVQATLHWDLSELSEGVRRAPKRVGIAWHAQGTEPNKGPSGRGPGEALTGSVFLDNVRLSADLTEFNRSAIEQHMLSLQDDYGSYTYTIADFDSEALVENGVLEFYDGTEIPTEFTIHGDQQFEYTIDDTSYRLGGGWQ